MVGTEWAVRRWETITGVTARPEQLEPLTRSYVDASRALSAADLLALMETGQLITRDVANWYASGYDLLLMATVAEPPTLLGELEAKTDADVDRVAQAFLPSLCLTGWCNLTGQPAISVPLHWTDDGLPMGAQLIAPYGREDLLIAAAAQLEQARPWAHRRPPV